MPQTKKFFIDKAFSEIGLAAYVYDLQPEDYDNSLSTANGMIYEWIGNGLLVGDWPVYDDPAQDSIAVEVSIPVTNWRAVWLNLGLALAPNIGKTPEGPTIALARLAYRTLCNKRLAIPQMQRPSTMPIGTGWNRSPKDRQFYHPAKQLDDGAGNSLDLSVGDGREGFFLEGNPI